MSYWYNCIEEAFDLAGITATKEQIDIVVDCVEGGHDNYSMAHGHDCIPSPVMLENKELKMKLDIEKNKVHCEVCNGTGSITSYGGTMECRSQCYKCHGEGRYTRK